NLTATKILGPIPSTISALHKLEDLTLSNISISGSIPSTISGLSSLTYFEVTCPTLASAARSPALLDGSPISRT
ncbi:unnamed protein product, partial [Closterium sp. Naga37s-1]